MRILKTAAVILTSFIVMVAGVGLFLPTKYTVERSVVIDAVPERIHGYVGDLRKWAEWAPWKEDQGMVVTFGQKTTGVGASQSWTGDSGIGALTITESSPESGIKYDLLFDGGKYECKSSMEYSRMPDGDTKVTWTMSGNMGRSLTGGYFALLMNSMIGSMFERGLSNLKNTVERGG